MLCSSKRPKMLPSLSFFRNDTCPFFKAGLCERPHCPFRHTRRSSSSSPSKRRDESSKASEAVYPTPDSDAAVLPLDPPETLKIKPDLNGKKVDVEDTTKAITKKTELAQNPPEKSAPNISSSSAPADTGKPELDEQQRLEQEYENILLGSDDEDEDEDVIIGSDVTDQFLLPQDTDAEDAAELVDACYKEWLKSNQEEPKAKSPTKEIKKDEPRQQSFHSPSKKSESDSSASSSSSSPSKRRLAHHADSSKTLSARPPAALPRKQQPTPAQTLQRRLEEARKAKAEADAKVATNRVVPGKDTLPKSPISKSPSLSPKRKLSETGLGSYQRSCSDPVPAPKPAVTKTVPQTNEKGAARKAHTPVLTPPEVRRTPTIPGDSILASKIPFITRKHTLEQLFKACENIYDSNEDACQRAVSEELALAKHKSKPVYIGASANCLKRLRDEAATVVKESAGQLNGSAKMPSRVDPRQEAEFVEKRSLYQAMKKYLLTPEQLTDNGFPRTHPSGDRGRITTKSRKFKTPYSGDPSKRVCDRCHKEFTIGLDGTPCIKEMCIYHHGRNFKRRVQGNFEGRYTCCDGEANSRGCTVANQHVSVHPSDEIYGFVAAVKDAGDDLMMGSDPWDVVALDCEMVYTTYGNELARATFISLDKKVLYDELVKPIHPIIDYNTRYSGITEDMMKNVTVTLTDVQAVMLTRIRPNSILIGHSLESDLMALKIKHDFVVDTSVMMPHRMGPPYKRALRTLASDHLGKIIQTGEHGHDSEEDAATALELVIWKVKEDRMILGCGDPKRLNTNRRFFFTPVSYFNRYHYHRMYYY